MQHPLTSDTKLPVIRILSEACRLPVVHFCILIKLCYPLLVMAALSIIASVVPALRDIQAESVVLSVLTIILYLAALTMAAVRCHKVFLSPPHALHHVKALHWNNPETRYFFAVVVLSIMVGILMGLFGILLIPLSIASDRLIPLTFLLGLPIFYIFARFWLILPAYALGDKPEITHGWQLSEGNGWRLTLLLVVAPILGECFLSLLPDTDTFFYALLTASVELFVSVITLALLSGGFNSEVQHEVC